MTVKYPAGTPHKVKQQTPAPASQPLPQRVTEAQGGKAKASTNRGNTAVWKKFTGAVIYSAALKDGRLILTLPYPPSANHYWRKTKQGRVYVSEDAKEYRALVADLFEFQGRKICEPFAGAVSVTYRVYFPTAAGDLSNSFKVLDDALNKLAWDDDRQIVHGEQSRLISRKRPRVEVVIEEVEKPIEEQP